MAVDGLAIMVARMAAVAEDFGRMVVVKMVSVVKVHVDGAGMIASGMEEGEDIFWRRLSG